MLSLWKDGLVTTQVYKCPTHGEFDLTISHDSDMDLAFNNCPVTLKSGRVCGRKSNHVIKIAAAFVPGGTGAGKGMHLKR